MHSLSHCRRRKNAPCSRVIQTSRAICSTVRHRKRAQARSQNWLLSRGQRDRGVKRCQPDAGRRLASRSTRGVPRAWLLRDSEPPGGAGAHITAQADVPVPSRVQQEGPQATEEAVQRVGSHAEHACRPTTDVVDRVSSGSVSVHEHAPNGSAQALADVATT